MARLRHLLSPNCHRSWPEDARHLQTWLQAPQGTFSLPSNLRFLLRWRFRWRRGLASSPQPNTGGSAKWALAFYFECLFRVFVMCVIVRACLPAGVVGACVSLSGVCVCRCVRVCVCVCACDMCTTYARVSSYVFLLCVCVGCACAVSPETDSSCLSTTVTELNYTEIFDVISQVLNLLTPPPPACSTPPPPAT